MFELSRIPPFASDTGDVVHILVETPGGSQNKYDYDPSLGAFVLDRPIHSALRYPFDYGFIPNTLAADGDPLDAVIIIAEPSYPGCVIKAIPVAVMDMEDEKGGDEKIISVAARDPRTRHIRDLSDIPPHYLTELEHFFIHIKDLEKNKWAKVAGFRGRAEALQVVKNSLSR